ncbi:hypothetical protein GCM10007205_10830 [Oxalicibacterium flavum]|uniref:Uncharacterized protein n=1 Tax=Oxalicibacterium flavum TaxID=179467 RepID=A0A8J2XX04_9BURK|nr:hypothetical protein [Oxalicibacterium flavum]GGC03491.1 hypothetical protein GCM10007205_10830 [Oxalicibacterium flavum]
MDWVPITFVTFKFLVLAIGMFYAIKWHYDQGRKGKEQQNEARAVLGATGKAVAFFILALLILGSITFVGTQMLGLDMS